MTGALTTTMIVAGLATAATGATPLLLAATGETVAERAGVLNLGLEGMMLLGAVAAFATTASTGSHTLGAAAGALAGLTLSALFALLTLALAANQVASGLAITIFGAGLSSVFGTHLVGSSLPPMAHLHIPFLSNLPILGPLLLQYDWLVYASIIIAGAASWALANTRAGMVLRAVGENAASAHALGHPVLRVRLLAVLFGGAMSGLAGAYLSLAATPMWVEGLTAGRGWIALALVVFGGWRPWRVLAGAYLFGGISVLQFALQGAGVVAVPSQVLAMIPYLMTILVLTVMSSAAAPACLGKPFAGAR